MRAHPTRRGRSLATCAVVAGSLAAVASATPAAAAPAPCGGTPQIADAAGDGHHDNTDVTAAWLSEAAGRLQAVIRPRLAVWEPAHDDSDAAGFALLFAVGGVTRYVRAEAPRGAPLRSDHGTWTAAGGFASLGATSGTAVGGPGGTVTLDVPGVPAGALLQRIFVLTYDGAGPGGPHWVDRAPGGTSPSEPAFGADYVTASCGAGGTPGAGPPGGAAGTTAVVLAAPRRVVGGGRAEVSGRVAPARAGVAVAIRAGRRTRAARTQADGTFSLLLPVSRTTRVRAVAGGIGSQTRTITVVSTVRLRVRLRIGGGVTVRGRVRPALPGRVLLLRKGAVRPVATTRAEDGRFALRLGAPRPGRYQAVFIPSGGHAERSTSNTGVIR